MNPDNDPFADAAQALLQDHCSTETLQAIHTQGTAGATALWAQLQAAGLIDALRTEDHMGAGLSLPQVFGVLEQGGAHALPLLLGESMVARALLDQYGIAVPDQAMALAQGQLQADGSLRCTLVRAARLAEHVLVQAGERCYVLACATAQQNSHAQTWDAGLHWPPAQVASAAQFCAPAEDSLLVLQAAVLAPAMAGALQAVFQRSLQYANTREQFGRPIGKFQAIQHQLAVMSEHVFAARMAAQLACNSEQGLWPDRLRVATAKACCSEAALAVSEAAHAIHGAIGFTQEYGLHWWTKRLHAWRQSAGSEAYWHAVAGQALLAHDGMTLDLLRRITDVGGSAPTAGR